MHIGPRFGGVYKVTYRDQTRYSPDAVERALPAQTSSAEQGAETLPGLSAFQLGQLWCAGYVQNKVFQWKANGLPSANAQDESRQYAEEYLITNDKAGADIKHAAKKFTALRNQLMEEYGLDPASYPPADKIDYLPPQLHYERAHGLPDADITTNLRIEFDLGDQVIRQYFELAKAQGESDAENQSDYFLSLSPMEQDLMQLEIKEYTGQFFAELWEKAHQLGPRLAKKADAEGRTQTVNVTYQMNPDDPTQFEGSPTIHWDKPRQG